MNGFIKLVVLAWRATWNKAFYSKWNELMNNRKVRLNVSIDIFEINDLFIFLSKVT